jgi:hypothetical protein
MDDTLPLDFRLLEIDEKTDGPAEGSQIVDTLLGVLAGQPFHTFRLDPQHVFDEQIGKVLSGRVTLVGECKRSFGGSPEAAKTEFCKKRPLVDLLEESGAQGVGNLKDGTQHALGQRIQLIFIGVDWRLSAARIDVLARKLSRRFLSRR